MIDNTEPTQTFQRSESSSQSKHFTSNVIEVIYLDADRQQTSSEESSESKSSEGQCSGGQQTPVMESASQPLLNPLTLPEHTSNGAVPPTTNEDDSFDAETFNILDGFQDDDDDDLPPVLDEITDIYLSGDDIIPIGTSKDCSDDTDEVEEIAVVVENGNVIPYNQQHNVPYSENYVSPPTYHQSSLVSMPTSPAVYETPIAQSTSHVNPITPQRSTCYAVPVTCPTTVPQYSIPLQAFYQTSGVPQTTNYANQDIALRAAQQQQLLQVSENPLSYMQRYLHMIAMIHQSQNGDPRQNFTGQFPPINSQQTPVTTPNIPTSSVANPQLGDRPIPFRPSFQQPGPSYLNQQQQQPVQSYVYQQPQQPVQSYANQQPQQLVQSYANQQPQQLVQSYANQQPQQPVQSYANEQPKQSGPFRPSFQQPGPSYVNQQSVYQGDYSRMASQQMSTPQQIPNRYYSIPQVNSTQANQSNLFYSQNYNPMQPFTLGALQQQLHYSQGYGHLPSESGEVGGLAVRRQPPLESYEQRAPSGKAKMKKRVDFTAEHLRILEAAYKIDDFVRGHRRDELANMLGITGRSITIWFQNRRSKERKERKKAEELRLAIEGNRKESEEDEEYDDEDEESSDSNV